MEFFVCRVNMFRNDNEHPSFTRGTFSLDKGRAFGREPRTLDLCVCVLNERQTNATKYVPNLAHVHYSRFVTSTITMMAIETSFFTHVLSHLTRR